MMPSESVPVEPGLVLATSYVDGPSITILRDLSHAVDRKGRLGAVGGAETTELTFDAATFRCDDGYHFGATAGGGLQAVAPRALWAAITGTLAEDPTDRCDSRMGAPGRPVLGAAPPEQPGDAWIADVVRGSPLLRCRWDPALRDADLDRALQRMHDGDDAEVLAAAHSLRPEPVRREWRWWRRPPAAPVVEATPADRLRDCCVAAVDGPDWPVDGPWDPVRELRGIAASMLGGPAWIPGLWPQGIDRIVARIERG
ncbi:hypothetical protein [Agrococcus jejuensis]|uniref:Uncharacterized protein n=1 Tax=Agrococcus jejuensis TaxID=399736 RepID=A0A1G8F315_9MICO|nr:hypothetical protein [Agrococcus jejuensis]SDH76501.1 hypothetical protein SAMN04489720_2308 [Agrococcus jejuensis]